MSSERDRCNSRHFTWLMKTCFPNPHQTTTTTTTTTIISPQPLTTISSLPDDVVLECLSRVPSSSLPSLSLVCRRWAHLLHSPHFSHLRRLRHLLRHSLFALAPTDSALSAATLAADNNSSWKTSLFHDAVSLGDFHSLFAHARLASIASRIFIIGRDSMVRYDTWTGILTPRSAMISPRKKFATAVVSGKIYVAGGGGSKSNAVEEYDPDLDSWRVVSHAPRRRYGCVGASVDGVLFVIGGLRIGAAAEWSGPSRAAGGADARHAAYASSMDLYDVENKVWLRSRTVPGGGCVVAACAAGGDVYILTSHTVELSFWKFDARRRSSSGHGGGEWCRIKSPPLPGMVRMDTRMRFWCVGMGDKVMVIMVNGWCVDEMVMMRGGCGGGRSLREGVVLVYECGGGEWRRVAELPEVYRRAAYVGVEC